MQNAPEKTQQSEKLNKLSKVKQKEFEALLSQYGDEGCEIVYNYEKSQMYIPYTYRDANLLLMVDVSNIFDDKGFVAYTGLFHRDYYEETGRLSGYETRVLYLRDLKTQTIEGHYIEMFNKAKFYIDAYHVRKAELNKA